MKSTLSSFVAFLCLLAFFVSSAACLAAPMVLQSSNEMHMHSMNGAGHACCPDQTPADAKVSNACCAIHHQPASPVSDAEWQQHGIVSLSAFQIPSLSSVSSHVAANFKPAPPRQPPLTALRI
jgi:hypothetical protein